jgi:isoleucyl-tRNA synthetase
MDALRRIIEQGRSARSQANIKIRQPLAEMLVKVTTQAELVAMAKFEEQLQEELNVKEIKFLDLNTDFVGYKLRPNLPVLGKRLGKKVPLIKKVLPTLNAEEIVANIRAGQVSVIDLDGEPFEVEPDGFLVDVTSPDGYAAIEDGGYLVALNINLTPELIEEGLVREVIRYVQNARKEAGLEVSDHINLGLQTEGEVLTAIANYQDLIQSESLADSLIIGVLNDASYTEEITIDNGSAIISITKI